MRDIDIRRALRREIDRIHRESTDTLVLDELALCQGTARVDVAVVNGIIHGFEIKSERDTLARLPGQRETYGRALDRVTIVVGPKYASRIAREVPSWWGIVVVEPTEDGDGSLSTIREGERNPSLDPYAQAQLLWREEALEALEERELSEGVRSKPRRELWRRLASELKPVELGALVRDCLRRRVGWRHSGAEPQA